MLSICPLYAKEFKCLADACTDSCCIGWEIGIDEKTLEEYKGLDGKLAERLSESINIRRDGAVLRLGADGRCPFLDSSGLCDIIKAKGECAVPEICREHPRYYNVLSDRTEWGVGLSCEEAARLILECRDVRVCHTAEEDAEGEECNRELESFLLFARERAFEILYASELPLGERLSALLYYTEGIDGCIEGRDFGAFHPAFPISSFKNLDTGMHLCGFGEILKLFSEMDFLDRGFGGKLEKRALSGTPFPTPTAHSELMITRLTAYFLHRYFITAVFDEAVLPKVKFALVSALTVFALTGNCEDTGAWINTAKAYSKEMEYNEDNRELFFEMCFTEPVLSTKNLISILT